MTGCWRQRKHAILFLRMQLKKHENDCSCLNTFFDYLYAYISQPNKYESMKEYFQTTNLS
jgi:hypothetical protein